MLPNEADEFLDDYIEFRATTFYSIVQLLQNPDAEMFPPFSEVSHVDTMRFVVAATICYAQGAAGSPRKSEQLASMVYGLGRAIAVPPDDELPAWQDLPAIDRNAWLTAAKALFELGAQEREHAENVIQPSRLETAES